MAGAAGGAATLARRVRSTGRARAWPARGLHVVRAVSSSGRRRRLERASPPRRTREDREQDHDEERSDPQVGRDPGSGIRAGRSSLVGERSFVAYVEAWLVSRHGLAGRVAAVEAESADAQLVAAAGTGCHGPKRTGRSAPQGRSDQTAMCVTSASTCRRGTSSTTSMAISTIAPPISSREVDVLPTQCDGERRREDRLHAHDDRAARG